MGNRGADLVTPLYPQKLALTSPTGGGRSVGIVRSRTKATEFSFFSDSSKLTVSDSSKLTVSDCSKLTVSDSSELTVSDCSKVTVSYSSKLTVSESSKLTVSE